MRVAQICPNQLAMFPHCTSAPRSPPSSNGRAEVLQPERGKSHRILELARRAMVPATQEIIVIQKGKEQAYRVTRRGWGDLPTKYGDFQQLAFHVDDEWREYHCLVKAPIWTDELQPRFHRPNDILLRIDSACIGGMIFGATDCDCHAQLQKAEELIGNNGEGIIIHISGQDGRGKGTGFKCGTQILQKRLKYDTVRAARALAGTSSIEVRTYGGAVAVLKYLLGQEKAAGFNLLSGNPLKEAALSENGFSAKLSPPAVPPTRGTIRHLRAKARWLSHQIPCVTL